MYHLKPSFINNKGNLTKIQLSFEDFPNKLFKLFRNIHNFRNFKTDVSSHLESHNFYNTHLGIFPRWDKSRVLTILQVLPHIQYRNKLPNKFYFDFKFPSV